MLEDHERIRFAELRAARRARVLAAMEGQGLDACLFGREANVRYVSGARRLWTAQSRPFVPTCAVVKDGGAVRMLSFSASYEGIPEELQPEQFYPVTWNPANFVAQVKATPGLASARRIGVDGMTGLFHGIIAAELPGASLVPAEPMMRALRRVKFADEIQCIRTAVAIAESALLEAARAVAPGVPEKKLQAIYLQRMCQLGTSQFAQLGTFTPITPNGGLRWITGDGSLPAGAAVATAGGALWAGYEGSLARTWWCGAPLPGPDGIAVARQCHDALAAVLEQCRPGISGTALAARFADTEAGRLGASCDVASLGLGHEGFFAGGVLPDAVAARQVIEPEMVLAIRLFLPSAHGGYLAEEMVRTASAGPELLTTLAHDTAFDG
jgi:Xaa-Pro dipeptidase